MKKIKRHILLLLYMTISIIGCSSLERDIAKENKNPNPVKTENKDNFKLPSGWEYISTITNEGTRSEGTKSGLFYRYKELPYCFNSIIIGRSLFEFKQMKVLWDDWGYLFIKDFDTVEIDSKDLITSKEIDAGWYKISLDSETPKKKMGTPVEWIFVKTEETSLWLSPDKIDFVVESFKLMPIPGYFFKK